MTDSDVARLRLLNQQIGAVRFAKPGDVVQWMGAIQAQDYRAGLWAVGLRTRKANEQSVEQAIAQKKIVRTWPMRGTLHFVVPSVVRWMLKYLTPRIVSRASFRFKQLRLDVDTFARCRKIIADTLRQKKSMTRESIYALLERNKISCAGQRGIHILWRLAQEGLICFGAHEGKHPTFVLLDEWIGETKLPPREEAIASLAKQFVASHGPVSLKDFSWWSGLTMTEARSALEDVKDSFASELVNGQTYWFAANTKLAPAADRNAFLLPAFDEFLVGYKDRSAAIDSRHARKALPGGGILNPTVVVDNQIVGTWRRTIAKENIVIEITHFRTLTKDDEQDIGAAAGRYGKFLGKKVTMQFEH